MNRFLLLAIAGLLCVAGAKKPQLMIRYYASGSANEGESFTTKVNIGGQEVVMSRAAVVTEKDFVSFYPVTAKDGTMGVYFRLTPHGGMLLQEATVSKRGGILLPMINGRPCQHMVIDRPISDGIVGIPSGLTPNDILLIDQKFPMMGEPGKKR